MKATKLVLEGIKKALTDGEAIVSFRKEDKKSKKDTDNLDEASAILFLNANLCSTSEIPGLATEFQVIGVPNEPVANLEIKVLPNYTLCY